MKGLALPIFIFVLSLALLAPGPVMAQPEQAAAVSNAPISQPLVREGDLAVKLVEALKLGKAASEADAESTLGSVGIAPKNGWIEDYPVTPDISGELQASIGQAADLGKISMGRDEALTAFQDVLAGYNLPVKTASSTEAEPTPENYPDITALNDYYLSEGPPAVTYYAPPPDYAYLYTWVPYPFWWSDLWFPGFYVLVDFEIVVWPGHFHHYGHRVFISNHFRDPRTGTTVRIDPTTRATGGVFTQQGARVPSVTAPQKGPQPFRGYGVTRPSPGTSSSAFERWGGSRFEGAASTRGFQSRSSAGQLPARAPSAPSGGGFRGGFSGFHGSGGFRGGGGFRR